MTLFSKDVDVDLQPKCQKTRSMAAESPNIYPSMHLFKRNLVSIFFPPLFFGGVSRSIFIVFSGGVFLRILRWLTSPISTLIRSNFAGWITCPNDLQRSLRSDMVESTLGVCTSVKGWWEEGVEQDWCLRGLGEV